jgi:hypothetical protein
MFRIRTVFILLSIVLMLAIGAAILADYNQPPFDPFSPYTAIMVGQPTSDLDKQEYSCKAAFLIGEAGYGSHCIIYPTAGEFNQIDLIPFSGQVASIRFEVRDEALKVGHLVALWGKPEVWIYDQIVNLYWESKNIRALGDMQNQRFSYFLPIRYVAFD